MPRDKIPSSKRRVAPTVAQSSIPVSPKRPRRSLNNQAIHEILSTESDDNCSVFDDDVEDPDFDLESTHTTESEQSEDDEEQSANLQIAEHHHEIIRSNHEDDESRSEQGRQNEEEAVNEEVRHEHCDEEEEENCQVRENCEQLLSDEHEQIDESTTCRPRYFYGRNRYKWSSIEPSRATRTRSHNIVNAPQQVSPTDCTTFGNLWKLFITEDMIEKIVGYTNEKLNSYRVKFKDTSRSELGATNEIELKALIGLLFYTSVFHSSHENAEFIFATDGTGREIFRCVMSKNRFLVLINCLRFDNAETRPARLNDDKLAAISEIFDEFINNCKQNYTLGTNVCIDEMLVGFRGRCGFKIYMPNKPNKYGLKVLLLVDAHSFYVYNAYIYHGRGSDGKGLNDEEKRLGIPSQSVIRLCKGIEGSNRNVTADNWFTSIELLHALKDRGLTYLGTMKKNKKEIPPEFQPHKDREIGTSLYGFTKDYTMVSYVTKPKKAVILVSSMHHNKETDVATNKPIMIIDYNKTKGGVDEVDKKCSNYSCSRRTRRWPMVLFYRLVDLSGVNTYVLYNKCTNKVNMRRGPFLLSLARELVLPEMKLRVYNERIPRELRLTMERVIGPTDMPEPPPPKNNSNPDPGTRKTCAICPSRLKRRTKYFCYHCKKPMCLTCCDQVCSDCKIRQ